MVPHVLRWPVSSGLDNPVWMRGILAFARAELMMFGGGRVAVGTGGAPPHGFDALTGQGTHLPWGDSCQHGSRCQMGAGRSLYRAQV